MTKKIKIDSLKIIMHQKMNLTTKILPFYLVPHDTYMHTLKSQNERDEPKNTEALAISIFQQSISNDCCTM